MGGVTAIYRGDPKQFTEGHLRTQSAKVSSKFRSKLDKIKGLFMCATVPPWRWVAHVEEIM